MPRVVNQLVVDAPGLAALRRPADGVIREAPDGDDAFVAVDGPVRRYRRTLEITPAEGRYAVREEIDFSLAIPFWGWLFVPVVRRHLRRREPPEPTAGPEPAPWWAPPDRFDARAATVVGLLCTLALVGGYLGTLITQTITFAADQFDADDRAQGSTLAAVRVGVLLALVVVAAADRRGRRLLLVGTAAAAILVAATGAAAPSLAWLGISQTVARGLSTALALLIGIVAAEELPAGSRAYGVSVLALTAALGSGMCVWFLPLADLGPDGWRILYVIPLLALPLVAGVGRRLPESRRFRANVGHDPTPLDRGRLRLLAVSGFLGSMFLAPASQFQNEFLRTERGFSATRISVFTLITSTPAGIGVAVGGRLADVRGRRLVGAVGLIGGTVLTVGFYLSSGSALWVTSTLGSMIAAATVPALGVYGPELFPTSKRGRANGIITVVGVAGSSVGLLLAGALSDGLGSLGAAMLVLAAGPLILAGLVLAFFPETAHRELEELNPGDEPVRKGDPRFRT
ncbi:MAG TPA: MFS transporter [Acidimicrobiales bacterium]|nr:MFS transporter [Acidimicrobiales bacterium]